MSSSEIRNAISAIFVVIALIQPGPSSAAAFLKLGNIIGDATEVDHKDWITILSVTETVSNPVTAPAGGPRFSDLGIAKQLDISSISLRTGLATGTVYPEAVIELIRSGGVKAVPLFRYKLYDAVITSISLSGNADEVPTEQFTLGFSRIEWTYIPIDATGAPGTPVTAGYDIGANNNL